jgi:hypothetical protein
MKLIPLTQGLFAQVDDDDYNKFIGRKWHAFKAGNTYYAPSRKKDINGKYKTSYLHREIMDTPKGIQCDHIDHNGLNCQRYNLRNCTKKQNSYNMKVRGKTGFHGVTYVYSKHKRKPPTQYIMAQITHERVHFYLGYYSTEIEAAKAYDAKAKELFGEFAYLNFPDA